MIDVNTLPFLPGCNSTKKEDRAFAKTLADSIKLGSQSIELFLDAYLV
jgi:hypothetical protein